LESFGSKRLTDFRKSLLIEGKAGVFGGGLSDSDRHEILAHDE
jgi:hypothetical protein